MDELMQARKRKLERELEEYQKAIREAQEALDAAEKELNEALWEARRG